MLLALKSFEILPKHKGYFFILECFTLIDIFAALTNKKTVASIIMQT